eukprot:CAMPEP_0175164730 /NCGR_PEP_ID=MMETSP0087-20121206/26603_1 /TAXON_ID=136419 /ORGANISM="Unknown Unknown, Strain D1" /LENGTH=82 /DNA_ID=CAMNT_0016453849 /DNA_START=98 /DNA_END=342 /DNA_ORIENTATION=+
MTVVFDSDFHDFYLSIPCKINQFRISISTASKKEFGSVNLAVFQQRYGLDWHDVCEKDAKVAAVLLGWCPVLPMASVKVANA